MELHMERRFGIALSVVVLTTGVWLGVRAHRVERHERAIAAIESLGGSVYVEYDRPTFLPDWVDDKSGWLVGLVRPSVRVAYWPAIERPEVLIQHLKELYNLQEIQISENLRHRKRDALSEAAVEAFEREFPSVTVIAWNSI
jgi:hypothetical protein